MGYLSTGSTLAVLLLIAVSQLSYINCRASGLPWVTIGSHTFHVSKDTGNWLASRDFCREKGGDLAQFKDEATLNELVAYIVTSGYRSTHLPEDGYWIGGTDLATETEWRWVDGDKFDSGSPIWSLWASGKPDGVNTNNGNTLDCLAIKQPDDDGKVLYDHMCSEDTFYSICQQD